MIECDELWSYVGSKRNQQWIWLAQDRQSREIVGCFIGSRDDEGAIGLWHSLPECYLDAQTYVDFWKAYDAVFYANTLHHVGKDSGQTNHIERFNNTLRQRCSRLVRKTLSFSKKLANHLGAIWSFIHHYNQSLLL
jgi:insertion element IS1 protein InsB